MTYDMRQGTSKYAIEFIFIGDLLVGICPSL